jgi:cellulose 1,4-beta-cellobiosidase
LACLLHGRSSLRAEQVARDSERVQLRRCRAPRLDRLEWQLQQHRRPHRHVAKRLGRPNRPTHASTSTDLNTFVNESRIDRRIHAGNWCNQSGAGLGERPRANPATGIDAYVWVKPPGESDGSSSLIPVGPNNPDGKGFDQMCDPNYTGNARNGFSRTGALANAPVSGAWFSAQFQELMANAFPSLS